MNAVRARSTASAGASLSSNPAMKAATRGVGLCAGASPRPAFAACGACARAAPAAPSSVTALAPRNSLRSTSWRCICRSSRFFPPFRPSSRIPRMYDRPTCRSEETTMRALSKPPRMPVLLIASLGCCTTLAHAESMDALYEKAKLEKTLVLYGAGPTGSHDRWIKDFQQRFPGVTVALHRRLEQRPQPEDRPAGRSQENGDRPGDLSDHPGFRQVEEGGRAAVVQARGLRDDRSGLQGRGRRVHRGQRQHHRLCLQHRAGARRRGAEVRARFSQAAVSRASSSPPIRPRTTPAFRCST